MSLRCIGKASLHKMSYMEIYIWPHKLWMNTQYGKCLKIVRFHAASESLLRVSSSEIVIVSEWCFNLFINRFCIFFGVPICLPAVKILQDRRNTGNKRKYFSFQKSGFLIKKRVYLKMESRLSGTDSSFQMISTWHDQNIRKEVQIWKRNNMEIG